MRHPVRLGLVLAAAAIAVLAGVTAEGFSQTVAPTNSADNPYRTIERWGEMPEGRIWGSTAGRHRP